MAELFELDREILDSIPVEALIQYLEDRLSVDQGLPRGPEHGIYYLPGPKYTGSWPASIKQYQQGALLVRTITPGRIYLESARNPGGGLTCLSEDTCAFLDDEDSWVRQTTPSKGVLR